MARIVRTAYRYKPPPKRKTPVTLPVPVIVTTTRRKRWKRAWIARTRAALAEQ
jgi:hypothetical protein